MKKIIYLVPVVAIILVAVWVGTRKGVPPPVTTVVEEENTPLVEEPTLPDQTLPLSSDPKTLAWNIFQKYVSYNKAHNLEGVKSVIYKLSPVCSNPAKKVECEARMDAAYEYGSEMNKGDFVNVWTDSKQTILSTDFWLETSKETDSFGRFRSTMFFVKDTEGNLKLLSFNPTQGGATVKGSATQEEIDTRIIRYTEDNDQDGRADYDEECLAVTKGTVCTKTNPSLRDTDGNGWWDGVDTLLNQ